MPSPPTPTVIIAEPSPTAMTLPLASTVTTVLLLETKSTVNLSGCVLTTILVSSPTNKSNVFTSTLTLALFKLTFRTKVIIGQYIT